jgi:drug/metabolite transporter (DMT)-like permease
MGRSRDLKAYAALAAIYFFWGTTYLGIRMSLESFQPLFLLGFRFLVSGALLVIAARIAGARFPEGSKLWQTAGLGLLLIGGGNGALVFSQLWIPSGLAALFVTTSPFWMVGLEAVLPRGERLHLPSLAGIAVGLAGVLFLVTPAAMRLLSEDGGAVEGANLLKGFFVLQAGCFCWCLGGALHRRTASADVHPFVSAAVQQFATGIIITPIAIAANQHVFRWSDRGVLAMAWLIVFGSVVGYNAFVYAMEHLPVPIVATYSYVNPVVAVILGWLFYREPFGWREMIAMVTVFAGVALVKYYSSRTPRPQVAEAKA